jgi:hypothetical protein
MTTSIKVFIISFILCSSLPAQEFRFGIVSSAISFNNERSQSGLPNVDAESSPKFGLFLALDYNVGILPFANLLLESNYEQDRSTWGSFDGYPYFVPTQHLRLDYLSLGILPQFHYDYSALTIYSITGAQLKFKLPGRYSYASDFSRKQLFQATLGGGLEFTFSSRAPLTVGTEIRYQPSTLWLFTQGTATLRTNPSFQYIITLRTN